MYSSYGDVAVKETPSIASYFITDSKEWSGAIVRRNFVSYESKQNFKTSIFFPKHGYTIYSINDSNKGLSMNGKYYLRSLLSKNKKINMDNEILGGMPVVKGRRIPVSLILACLRDGMTASDILEDYKITPDETISAVNYAIDLLDHPFTGDEDEDEDIY